MSINADLLASGATNKVFTAADKSKLDALGSPAKRGVAVRDDAVRFMGIPDTGFTAGSTVALTAGRTYYVPFIVRDHPRTLTDWAFNVVTGPASAANVRHAIYAADTTARFIGGASFGTRTPRW